MRSSRSSKRTRSKNTRSSRTLEVSLLAGVGAAGVMAADANAGIVTTNLNQTATANTPLIYFNYVSGTFSTTPLNGVSVYGLVSTGKGSFLSRSVSTYTSGQYQVAGNVTPGASIGAANSWFGGGSLFSSNQGYWGVRFPAGGSNYNYGWVQVGYTPTGLTFGQAAVETTVNTPIAAGTVPEIDPASAGSAVSLVAGVLAMVEQRRRKRLAAADSVVA